MHNLCITSGVNDYLRPDYLSLQLMQQGTLKKLYLLAKGSLLNNRESGEEKRWGFFWWRKFTVYLTSNITPPDNVTALRSMPEQYPLL